MIHSGGAGVLDECGAFCHPGVFDPAAFLQGEIVHHPLGGLVVGRGSEQFLQPGQIRLAAGGAEIPVPYAGRGGGAGVGIAAAVPQRQRGAAYDAGDSGQQGFLVERCRLGNIKEQPVGLFAVMIVGTAARQRLHHAVLLAGCQGYAWRRLDWQFQFGVDVQYRVPGAAGCADQRG